MPTRPYIFLEFTTSICSQYLRKMQAKAILPTFVLITGLPLLNGCFFIPTFGMAVNGTTNYSRQIGRKDSTKPVRLLVTTRTQIENKFGPPAAEAYDHHHVIYHWNIRFRIWVAPLFFRAANQDGRAWIELEYDNDGTLRGVQEYQTSGAIVLWGEYNGLDDDVPRVWKTRYPPQGPPADTDSLNR